VVERTDQIRGEVQLPGPDGNANEEIHASLLEEVELYCDVRSRGFGTSGL
jgi:hypothetical protein